MTFATVTFIFSPFLTSFLFILLTTLPYTESGLPVVVDLESSEYADSIPPSLIIDCTMNQGDEECLPLTPPKPNDDSMMPSKDTPFTKNHGISPSRTHDHFVIHCGTYFYQEMILALSEMWEILCIKPFLFAVLGNSFLCLICKLFGPSFQHTHLYTHLSVNVYLTVSVPYASLLYYAMLC